MGRTVSGKGNAMNAWSWFGSSRRELAESLEDLVDLFAVTPQGSRQVTVIGPKGGGTKTSTVAAVLHLLSDRVVGMLVGVDCNADKGTLTQRMGLVSSQVPSRLLTLAKQPSSVQYLVDLSAYLDRVGRVHLLHNDGVASRDVDRITREQYDELLVLLSRYAEITVVDTGTSMVHPSTLAALDRADHVVIAAAAEPPALQITTEGVAELVALGYGQLIAESTMVATVTDPAARPDAYAQGVDFFAARCGHVQVVPYDRAAGAVGSIRWNTLRPATEVAYARIAGHVARSLSPANDVSVDAQRQLAIHRESPVARWVPRTVELSDGAGDAIKRRTSPSSDGILGAETEPAGVDSGLQLPAWAVSGPDDPRR